MKSKIDMSIIAMRDVGTIDFDSFVSAEQSLRALNGNAFNHDVTDMLHGITNKTDVIFMGAEPKFEKHWEKRGIFKCKPIYLQMDHWFLIVDSKRKKLLSVLSDGTTTFRHDRAKIKRAEGIDQMRLKDVIEEKIIKQWPKFVDYQISHVNVLLFPTSLNASLRNKKKEERAIAEFCANLNNGTNEFRTFAGCHQIDAAMTISQLKAVIKEIKKHKKDYSFSQSTLANAWKKLYHIAEYLPVLLLNENNARKHKKNLVYSLNNHPDSYHKAELESFLVAAGVYTKKTATKKSLIAKVCKVIETNY